MRSLASDSAARSARTWRIGRAAAGALGLIFGILYLLEGQNLALGRMRAPGPGVFPLVVGVIFVLVCIGVIADALWSKQPGSVDFPKGQDLNRLVIIFGSFVVYVAVLNVFGFLLATVLLVTVFTRLVGDIPWLKATACGVGVTLLVWSAFVVLLGVQLPAGIWV